MKLEQVLVALAAIVRAAPLEPRDVDYPGLYFSNGKFEITMFNDLHLGDFGIQDDIQKGTWSDDLTVDVMNKVLDYEHGTNLAVLNGDITTCEWLAEKDSYRFLDKAMQPFLNRKLPFTATFGNHDWSATCNTRWMSEHIWRTANDRKNGGQLTFTTSSVAGDPNLVGTTNYFIPLYSNINGKQVLKMVLWFFDSKGGFGYTGDGNNKQDVYGYVHSDVVDWFKRTRKQLENEHGGKPVPSLVFAHIPILITDKYAQAGLISANKMPGIQWHEELGVQDDNKGIVFMQGLVDTPGLLGVFSGHDHKTDWCMKWTETPKPIPAGWPSDTQDGGLNICFGRHTGYGGYSEVMRGGRHIVIFEDALGGDNAIETWNRLEDGEISGRVMLNSTYGIDKYPRVEVKLSDGTIPKNNDDIGETSFLHEQAEYKDDGIII
ncbi:Metallo-dependent phosphatase [Paraphaeosphaeria sporulosa]|uniref:Metallo-dependent phosphatase n=1 Tax=Paraphaeosphaeria sporulosa TaxID=1460663 RepID=A0A177C087_9PLEO|nr:Metallo-dependent phosphatase [Paraphaeosphaeria sporulosa]OAG01204.1 Metallo-dependent phosphatase [Paraphaeosphaeria sporulosa]